MPAPKPPKLPGDPGYDPNNPDGSTGSGEANYRYPVFQDPHSPYNEGQGGAVPDPLPNVAWGPTVPFTWAAGDNLTFNGTYFVG